MRRFEFVEGTSAKFWMASVEGTTFTVVYGRLGTEGQRKDKAFPSEDAARRELEKKINEKVREGYAEVAAGAPAAAAGAKGVKGAVAAAPRLVLPPRVQTVPAVELTDAKVAAAVSALTKLREALTVRHRSYWIAQLARRARRALEAIAGADPKAHKALGVAFDALMAQVVAPVASRLPLRFAFSLLLEVHIDAFSRALGFWQSAAASLVKPSTPPGIAARGGGVGVVVGAIVQELVALEDPELVLRLGALICARPDLDATPEAIWTRRWLALRPHVEARLSGLTLEAHVQGLASSLGSEVGFARRVQWLF